MAPTFNDVYGEKYLLLTTFTKDGRPKPTPVWGVPDGDKLLISTDDGSWKTKRINNTPRVTIQKCGVLGKPKGEPVEAVARNLPKSETRRVFDMVTRRYWWHAWWWVPQALLRGGVDKVHAAIEIAGGATRRRPALPGPRNPQRPPGVGTSMAMRLFLVYAWSSWRCWWRWRRRSGSAGRCCCCSGTFLVGLALAGSQLRRQSSGCSAG